MTSTKIIIVSCIYNGFMEGCAKATLYSCKYVFGLVTVLGVHPIRNKNSGPRESNSVTGILLDVSKISVVDIMHPAKMADGNYRTKLW